MFVWIEYVSERERTIKTHRFSDLSGWRYTLLEEDGHFSFVKILPNNKLFVVRWQNICEIREMNEAFSVLHQYKNIGDEIIAVDIFYYPSKDKMIEIEEIKEEASSKKEKEPETIKVKHDEENMSITILDLDGNINVIENNSISKVLNLFEMGDIPKEYKEKQFFSMGYPYFIKTNTDYFAFSSDHGVFVIKK